MNKDKIYSYVFGVSLGIAIVGTITSLILFIANWKTEGQIEQKKFQDFYNKCATACAPNGVYSISYNKCACSAIIVYREVK